MIPLRLHLRNFRRYADVTFDFPDGVVALVGENGAGKSSIVDAVELALFANGSRDLAPNLTLGEREMFLQLDFEHGGLEYHVTRTFTGGPRGKATLDLTAYQNANRGPLTRETAAATQAELERIIGMRRETFRASAFCGQGDGAAFAEAGAADRKRILSEILDLEVWARLRGEAEADRAGALSTLDGIDGMIGPHEEILARKSAALAEREAREIAASAFGEAFRRAGVALRQYAEEAEAVREAIERRKQLQAEEVRLQLEVRRLEAIVADGEKARAELDSVAVKMIDLSQKAADAEMLQAKVTHGREARRLRETALERQKELRAQVVQLRRDGEELLARANEDHEGRVCDRCQQVLGGQAALAAAESWRAEAETKFAEAMRANTAVDEVPVPRAPTDDLIHRFERDAEDARSAAVEVARLEEQRKNLEQRVRQAEDNGLAETLTNTRHALVETSRALQGQPALSAQAENPAKGERLRRQLEDAQIALQNANVELGRAQALVEQVQHSEAKLGELYVQREAGRERLLLLETAVRAYGRDGVPALILENSAIPQLEQQANDVLERWGSAYRVELRTQRELKTRDGAAEALDIVCLAPGGERAFESFSGGERTRIALALRLGLARLLARRRQSACGLLVIDEPEGLDEDGMSRLPDLLEGLSEYRTILVVSHNPVLSTAFDRVIRAPLSSVREEVAA